MALLDVLSRRRPDLYGGLSPQPTQAPTAPAGRTTTSGATTRVNVPGIQPSAPPTTTRVNVPGMLPPATPPPGMPAPRMPRIVDAHPFSPEQRRAVDSLSGQEIRYSGNDPLAWLRQVTAGMAPATENLSRLIDVMRAGGANVSWATNPNTGAQSRDVVLIDGVPYDLIRDVGGPQAAWQFGGPHGGGGGGVGGAPGVGGAGNVFSDPATQEWERLLRTLTDRLNQPAPVLTDAQRDLMQTQALDPLERQRQATRQRTTEHFASRGINPGSGILEQALIDADRHFDQLRTGVQSQFAIDQINREDRQFANNEARAINALNLFQRIPQLADQRLGMAQQALIPSNPYHLMGLQQQQQQFNQAQNQAFWGQLAQLLAEMFR